MKSQILLFMFIFISVSLFSQSYSNWSEIYEESLNEYKIKNIPKYEYVFELIYNCDGCIRGSNKESFYFLFNPKKESFFSRIGLYSNSKIISLNNFLILDFYMEHISILQNEIVENKPPILIHQGVTYQLNIYENNILIYSQLISKYTYDDKLYTEKILVKFIRLLKESIFDISITQPYEYGKYRINRKQKKILKFESINWGKE